MKLSFSIFALIVVVQSFQVLGQCKINGSNDVNIYCGTETEISAEANWAYTGSFSSSYFSSLQFVTENVGYAIGTLMSPYHGLLLKTTDGGFTWTQSDIPSPGGVNSVFFTSVDTGYVAAGFHTILKTTNGGTSWSTIYSSGTSDFNSVYFVNASTGFFGTSGGTILKTTDAGTSFNTIAVSTQSNSIFSLHFIDENIGFAGTGVGEIFKTTDGGNTWGLKSSTGGGFNFHFINGMVGFSGGQFGKILKTTDAGETWFLTQSNTSNDIAGITFLSSGKAVALLGGNSGAYLMSSDNGVNWVVKNSAILDNFSSLYNVNGNTIIAIGSNGKVMRYSEPLSYSWTPNTFISDNTIQNPVVNPNQTTKYYVTATFSNGCISTDSVLVNISDFSVNAGLDKSIVCGDSIQMDDVIADINTTFNYAWLPETGVSDPHISNPKIAVTDTTIYTVTLTTANGCSASDEVRVAVVPFQVSSQMTAVLVCGQSTEINPISSNYLGAGSITYAWSPSIGIDDTTLANPIFDPIEQTTYHLLATTYNGCQSETSVTISVTSLSISLNNVEIICGDSSQFFASTNYLGTEPLTYEWGSSVGLSDSTIANPIVKADTTTEFILNVATQNGCQTSSMAFCNVVPMDSLVQICLVSVNEDNKNIIVWDKPVSSSIDTFVIFKETSITNQYVRIGEVDYDSLSIFIDTNSNPSIQSNRYTIAIKDKCGLESTASESHKTMHLAINQGIGTTWNLIWEPYEGFDVTSYLIYRKLPLEDFVLLGSTSGTSTQYSDVTAPAGHVYYQVEVLTNDICNPTKSYNSSRSNIATNDLDGIVENILTSVAIYPNPSSDFVTVELKYDVQNESKVQFYTVNGELVLEHSMKNNEEAIDIENLVKGVYFVQIKSGAGVYTTKLVKI